jgi:rhamnose utilization protein RhaD (predicted bifunctional aldolase and dehydrogenase)
VKSLWNDQDARAAGDDPVALRTYTSRLLGQAPDLVLHGGGNTSVKAPVTDFFGDEVEVLQVKGSGWDLATIEPAGFSPVRQDTLMRMADLDALTDTDMVREQRAALLNPYAPNPSVEAILHALIPFRYVDHTHTDAVVTVTNAPDGPERVRRLYGDRVLYVPYVMPGFVLAREVRRLTRDVDWSRYEGMVLLHHGLFTWSDDAREAYERMIALVTLAEEHLRAEGAWEAPARASAPLQAPPLELARLRRAVSVAAKGAVVARFSGSEDAAGFAGRADVADLATRGPVTPDHVIRTKRTPVIFDADASADPDAAVAAYVEEYRAYFTRNDPGGLTCLEPSPRWGVWRGPRDPGLRGQREGGRPGRGHRAAHGAVLPVGRSAGRLDAARRGRHLRDGVLGAGAGQARQAHRRAAASGQGRAGDGRSGRHRAGHRGQAAKRRRCGLRF